MTWESQRFVFESGCCFMSVVFFCCENIEESSFIGVRNSTNGHLATREIAITVQSVLSNFHFDESFCKFLGIPHFGFSLRHMLSEVLWFAMRYKMISSHSAFSKCSQIEREPFIAK